MNLRDLVRHVAGRKSRSRKPTGQTREYEDVLRAKQPSAAEPALNLANDPAWLTLLYWMLFIWAPDAAVLGNAFGYWVATHTYLIRDSSEAEPSRASECGAKPRSRRGNREKKRP